MAITLDADWISDISPYSVGDSGTITATQFSRYLGIVEDRAEADGATDYMVALLVCDIIERRKGDINTKSEKIGSDYSIQYDDASITGWMRTYLAELQNLQKGTAASEGVDRADSVLEFAKLDQVAIPDDNADDDFTPW